MNQKYVILLLIIFAIVTFSVVYTDTSATRQISFRSQDLNLKVNQNAKFENTDVSLSSRNAKINSEAVKIANEKAERVHSQKNKFNNTDAKYENSNVKLNQQYDNGSSQTPSDYSQHQNNPKQKQHYIYKNIDWNTWKSEFVNKILDDSIYIESLDNYKKNTWFYYSFFVTATGRIEDIKIISFALKQEDRKLVKKLIKSYEYDDITVFPANTKKRRVKVEAVMILGDYEKKSNPSDFNENEKVKLPY